jgi:hypothetical protein
MPLMRAARRGVVAVLLWGAAVQGAPFVVPPHLQPHIRVPVPAPERLAEAVRPLHPRLILTAERQTKIKQLRADSPLAREWYRTVIANAAAYERVPPIAYVPEKPGERAQEVPMLHPGRALVDRVCTLGLVAVLDHDERAMAWLRRELMHALEAWPDWQYGLARYEIAAGVALAYDWLYDRWTAEERARLSTALQRLALEPFAAEFAGFAKPSERNAGIVRNNVNLVCNAGASVAALAVIDEYPALAGDVLAKAFALLQVALPGFGEDGAWNEGVAYWKFGVRHLVQYLACLDSAAGTDFGLVSTHAFPGFARTCLFPLAMTSPTGRTFNFADDNGGSFSSATLLWLGANFRSPLAVAHEEKAPTVPVRDAAVRGAGHETAREVVQRLLYYRPEAREAAPAFPALDLIYRDAGVATLRSSWTDPQATFVGIKAGSAAGNRHAHLDSGTVIIDALGERWLAEIGRGPYTTRYFSQDRYLFFQARTEGHNTLLVASEQTRGGNQSMSGKAVFTDLQGSAGEAACGVDLTGVYAGASRVVRTVRLFAERRRVSLADEVELPEPGRVRWHAYTPAPIVLPSADGRTVTLKFRGNQDPNAGPRAVLALVSADPAQRFVVEPAAPLPDSEAIKSEPIAGFTRLAIVSGAARTHRIIVEFTPRDDGL